MTANKATPEELVEFLRKVDSRQQSLTSALPPYSKFGEAADLIESQRNAVIEEGKDITEMDKANTSLAMDNSNLRTALENLIEAVDGIEDLDEMDGEKFSLAMGRLDHALAAARPFTEEAIIAMDNSAVPVERQCES